MIMSTYRSLEYTKRAKGIDLLNQTISFMTSQEYYANVDIRLD